MTIPEPVLRPARRGDLPAIVGLLADDPLGSRRESATDPLPESYHAAFDAIERDANNELIVVELDEAVVGVLQLTFTPGILIEVGGGHRSKASGLPRRCGPRDWVGASSCGRSSGRGPVAVTWFS